MPLTFPTLAEQCLQKFHEAKKTTSLVRLAKALSGEREMQGTKILYTFPDDTALLISGRGRAHQVTTLLP